MLFDTSGRSGWSGPRRWGNLGVVISRADERPPAETERSRSKLALTGLGVLVVAITAMYIFAFFFASGKSPDKVPDRAWAVAAEARCASDRARIYALPPARTFRDIQPLTEALRQRAVVLDRANAMIGEELAALKALPIADDTTRKLATQWLADYDVYLTDREAHSLVLKAGKDDAFTETTYKGSPMSNRMDAFARVNLMKSCQVPLDVA